MARVLKWMAGLFVMFVALPAALLVWTFFKADNVPKASILHVVLDGPLSETPHPNLGALLGGPNHITLRGLTAGIRRAATDDRIVGMILDVRTPEVGLAQLEEIAEAVDGFRDSGKWNVAYLETAGELGHGDGAYALATLADEVILSPPGEINLTGLRAEVPFFKETFERVGVQPYTEQRYEYKNFANTFTQTGFTPPHKEALKGVLDDLQQTLLEIIAEGRDVDVPTARTWVSQAPFSADAALEDKLVDRLAYWDEVVEDAKRVAGRDEPFMEADSYGARRALTAGGVRLALIIGAGEINRGESGSGGMGAPDGIGSDTFAQAFRDARQDGVKGVLFRIDSPGGSYIASDLIRREVELTRKAGIPVVVSMGNTAASGGYFIAADADAIVAEPGTITGSIGVFAASFAVRQALHRWLGVNFDTYETLPHAGSLNWLDPPSDADRARFSQTVDRIYKDFVTKVAAGRHKTYDEIHAVARGRIWSGRQAVQNGLADELGGMETALEALRRLLKLADDQEVHLTLYPEPENALAMLRNLLSVQTDLPRPVRAALGPWLRLWSSPGARALLPLQPEPL